MQKKNLKPCRKLDYYERNFIEKFDPFNFLESDSSILPLSVLTNSFAILSPSPVPEWLRFLELSIL